MTVHTDEFDFVQIYEINSGYQDHKDFKRVLQDIMSLIKSKFNASSIDFDDIISIDYTLKSSKYKNSIHEPTTIINQKVFIIFKKETKPLSQTNKLFTSGGTYFGPTHFVIKIGIDKNKTIFDLKNNVDEVEEILTHELVHIFQNLYDNYKKTQAYYEKARDKSGDTFGKWYWTNKFEIDAYITQINTKLKQIKQENPDITFKSAMLTVRAWKELNSFVPKSHKDLLKRVLRKTAHYWINNLGGKINEFIIKLK